MCICEPCPTYNECMRAQEQLLFCMNGKSPTCTFEKKGCRCPTCPVAAQSGRKETYYCILGSAAEQG
jgi:hypothetical protein